MSEEKIYNRINEIDQKHDNHYNEMRDELHLHIQSINGHMHSMATSAAVISERLQQTRRDIEGMPPQRERPCVDLKEHLLHHEKYRFAWVLAIIGAIVSGAAAAIGTTVAFLKGQ